jgi:uncharacterized membrane protein
MVPGRARDIRESIPGKNKTVRFDDKHPYLSALAVFLMFSVFGLLLLWAAPKMFVANLVKHDFGGMAAALFMALFGVVMTFPGVLAYYLAIDSSRCLPMDELSQRLNVPEEALHKIAREKGIHVPRYEVRGRALYRPGDFDALSLLRASTPPVTPDALLRADSDRPTSS